MSTNDVRPKCKKHGDTVVIDPENGNYCSMCEREDWDWRAKNAIKDLKCPICCAETELEEYDSDYISFKCKKDYHHGSFRSQVCETCWGIPWCVCEPYPEQEGSEY